MTTFCQCSLCRKIKGETEMKQRDMNKLVCPIHKIQLSVHSHNTYRCPMCGTIYKWNQLKGKLEVVQDTRGGA